MYGVKGISQTGFVKKDKQILSIEELKIKSVEYLNKVHNLSLKKLGHQVFPQMLFDLKCSKTMGKADRIKNTIHLNPEMLRKNPHELEDTVIHEYCHLLDYKIFKGWGHQKTWKKLMSELGGNPMAKAVNVSMAEATTKYIYSCGCSKYVFTLEKHDKAKNKELTYICKKCRNTLKFKKTVFN